eukprot:7415257-Pyramimonas_sp.AAC.1
MTEAGLVEWLWAHSAEGAGRVGIHRTFGYTGRVYWEGRVYREGRYTGRVYWEGIPGGYTGRVNWEGTPGGYTGR